MSTTTIEANGHESYWKKSALLVVDMQNDFICPGGPFCLKTGESILPAVKKAVAFARERGVLIVWVVREHHASGRDVERFRQLHYTAPGEFGPVVKGTKGAALVDGLEARPEDHHVVKFRFSSFFATNLDALLRRCGIENLVITGVQTPNCIRATAYDAVAYDYPCVVVISDATTAADPQVHIANLSDMRNIGVATPTLAEWMQQ